MFKLYKIVYKGKLYTGYNKKALKAMLWDIKVEEKRNKNKKLYGNFII